MDHAQLTEHRSVTVFEKIQKIGKYIQKFDNWFECLKLRSNVNKPTNQTATVCFRNGLKMNVRVGTPDISIIYEVLIGGAYASAERLIKSISGPCSVIDLGANIGAFSLRCGFSDPNVQVYTYEPGPQNLAVLHGNISLNPAVGNRVHVFEEAASGDNGEAFWHYDEKNPGGSSLTGLSNGVPVPTRSLPEIVSRCDQPIALIKMDIEGSEYEILDKTPCEVWDRILAILAEVHGDPSGRSTPRAWFEKAAQLGYRKQEREYSTVLLSR